mmetsp:Transcript_31017/g.78481  ORF Transcript_31017/g.78481 Transcript_31017/m.78481 type:complete len:544 (+) Transcript_31017:82-1713(+)
MVDSLTSRVLLAIVVGAVAAPTVAVAAAGKPHVVMVLVDDWGWNNAGFHRPNDPEVVTPNIDKLVKEGIELDRHYTYHYCSPSRATLQSGRLSVHVSYGFDDPLLVSDKDHMSGFSGIPRNMTGIAAKMRSAGYRTHMTGKWDAGMATWDHTPMGRGYETFFGYFHHAEDYWTQRLSDSDLKPDICGNLVDLWNTTGPARGRNGTAYVEEMFTENTLGILDRHDPAEPLFLFHSFHLIHTPLQVPKAWEDKFSFLENPYRRKYAAMASYMDGVMGQIVAKLQAKGMWENTLIVVSSDNGGPTYNLPVIGPGAASNLPLKGGKMSDWEGGVRVNAFVSGGAIPESKRGSKLEDYVHMSDWYATFCAVAGVNVVDERAAKAGLPPVDGIDHSELLLGKAAFGTGKRQEIHHSARALTMGNYKLITGGMTPLEYKLDETMTHGNGTIPFSDYLNGYEVPEDLYRNAVNCESGCLYDVKADPYETNDIAHLQPLVLEKMMARLSELNKGLFLPDRGIPDSRGCTPWTGFYGPFIDVPAEAPVVEIVI